MSVDVIDGLLHRGDLFRLLIRDLALELLLERHHQLDRVERVGPQIIDKSRLRLDIGFVHAELFRNDLLDALFDGFDQVALPGYGDICGRLRPGCRGPCAWVAACCSECFVVVGRSRTRRAFYQNCIAAVRARAAWTYAPGSPRRGCEACPQVSSASAGRR